MTEPKPIQLVLQGGGAKIFALVAALDAIHRAVQDRKILVKRIAGTSAGAIVGSLYAAGVAPSTIRQAFAGFPLDRLVQFGGRLGKAMALGRALRNLPLADDRPIAQLLDRLFRDQLNPGGGPVLLSQLPIPTLLVASDVSGRERIVYDSGGQAANRPVVSCVMDSCAIPFFFRAAGKDANTLVLDGGLCENLASELLVRDVNTYGDVVAISFAEEAPATPRSPRELAVALLDTAISASVRRAKTVGNLFLIELDPYGIGTFDFDKAHNALRLSGDSSKFDNARLKTAQMIDEFHSATGKRRVSKSRWEHADPITMGQLLKIYKSQQLPRPFRYLSRRLVIEANSLLHEGEDDYGSRDLLVQMLEFAPSTQPIDSILAQFFTDPGQTPSDVSCDVYDSAGQAVPFQPVPVRDPENERMFGLMVFFTPPLEPAAAQGKTYFLRSESRVGEAFGDLKRGEVDSMESKILRADGAAGRVELVVHIPKSFGPVTIAPHQEDGKQYFPAEPMRQQELWRLQARGQFQAHGWRAENVPTDGIVRIDLKKV